MNPEHLIRAAQGYYELGMSKEALAELRALPPEWQSRPEILELRLLVLMRMHRWRDALDISLQLCESNPGASSGFIHAAFCLHELGRTAEAKQMLVNGPDVLRGEPVYFYNLACYEATLGERDAAIENLERSFKLDKKYREFARQDPDLVALRGLYK